MKEIVDLYQIPNNININRKRKIDKKTQKVVWKTCYQLFLGPELFEQMLLSYKDSLKRKRPENYK
ncbi:MAG: hypothetical protein CEE43_05500 [Promethearchaeota archaeon Loki_b32]|nr:MAG: hypothetical protein CEE43_05500 [Candidatus Lokiarchaeota archaeon Loki_b32]